MDTVDRIMEQYEQNVPYAQDQAQAIAGKHPDHMYTELLQRLMGID